jgi:WD40 repeat protein
MDDREARKKKLAEAKSLLEKRKRQRAELAARRAGKTSDAKKDYGKSALEATTAMIEKFQSHAAEETSSEASRPALSIPGRRTQLKEDVGVNEQTIVARAKEVYSKSCSTSAQDIALDLGIITEKTTDLEIERMMIEFMKDTVAPWPPKSMDAKAGGDGGPEDAKGDEDEEILLDMDEIKKEEAAKEKEKDSLYVLAEDESTKLLSSGSFMDTFDQVSTWMERALAVNKEHAVFWELDELHGGAGRKEASEAVLTLKETFSFSSVLSSDAFGAAGTGGRGDETFAVNCLDFSQVAQTDLLLATHASPNASRFDTGGASYGSSMGGSMIADGLVSVWHLLNPRKPEYKLEAQSMISSARFHPSNPGLVVGATVNGQILAWDLRTKKNIPQFRSRSGHYAPVFSMQFLGHAASSSSRLNFVTVSNVGQVCVWKDEYLVAPQDTLTLKQKAERKSDDIPASAFGIAPRDTKNMIIGCDDGHIYKTDVHAPASSDTLLYSNKVESAHYGPITQVQFHPVPSGKDIGRATEMLFLTSSYDWTVKLWHCDAKEDPKEIGVFREMQDYVYDVAWSPVHPSVFAAADGSGRITVFDLNFDFESPKGSISIPLQAGETGAVTSLSFSPDGRTIAAGDYRGNVYVYEVNRSLYECNDDDFKSFEESVTKRVSK